jgi:uncharacterized cupin superfamily protein
MQVEEKTMAVIEIKKGVNEDRLDEMGVPAWLTWSAEESEFPWHYDDKETCYFLEGDVILTPENGEAVEVGKGDLVIFPQGISCTWKIRSKVLKHYRFGD